MPNVLKLFKCFGKSKRNQNVSDNCNGKLSDHIKENECMTRETRFLSNAIQTTGCSDAYSASIGCWSGTNQIDGCDTSEVNLLSNSLCTPLSGVFPAYLDEYRDRLETFVIRLENTAKQIREKSPGLINFENMLDSELKTYLNLSEELGGNIKNQSICVREAFELVRDWIENSSIYSKPSDNNMEIHLKPLNYKLIEISVSDEWFLNLNWQNFSFEAVSIRHYELSIVGDSALILFWINSTNASQFVKGMQDSTQVCANKVVQHCRKSLPKHVEWLRSWLVCLAIVCTVIDEHFPDGLIWNSNGPTLHVQTKSIIPVTPLKNCPNLSETYQRPSHKGAYSGSNLMKANWGDDQYRGGSSINSTELLTEIKRGRQQLRHVNISDF